LKNKIEVLCHSSIRISGSKIIYVDPFKIKENYHDADYIFCTHSHYDHFSEKDIRKVMKSSTITITDFSSLEEAMNIINEEDRVKGVEPKKHYKINDIEFETTYAYNKNKKFHPKKNDWVRIYFEFRWREDFYCRRYR